MDIIFTKIWLLKEEGIWVLNILGQDLSFPVRVSSSFTRSRVMGSS